MIVRYYMVSLGLPRNFSTYFKAKSKRQIRSYCKANDIKVVHIFEPTDTPERGVKCQPEIKYQDISNFKIAV